MVTTGAGELDELLTEVVGLATGAGEILTGHYGSVHRGDAGRKGGRRRDLVSRADIEAERFLIERIPVADDILGEEGGRRDSGAERRWIVDPLDGTVNFLHGIPFWGVSIAVLEAGEPLVAAVHAPALGQTFTAATGRGCRLDGVPVFVSETRDLADSVLATGFAYARDELADDNFDNTVTLGHAAAGLRRLGSAALDLAYTACGKLDGFWELHLEPWDVAAGSLLVREAGGIVTDFRGSSAGADILFGRNIVASNGKIYDAIRSRLAPLRGL